MLKIDNHLLTEISNKLLTYLFQDYYETIQALINLNSVYNLPNDIETTIVKYLTSNINEISFFVYQSIPEQSNDVLNINSFGSPIRYDSNMLQRVMSWYKCKECIKQLSIYYYKHNNYLKDNPVYYKDWLNLFCTYHSELVKDKVLNWRSVKLEISHSQYNVTIYTYIRKWKWC
jgi:hypothetical protein